ncbi:hypothetical protein LguiB_003445 [Lonicera macranthoides]
MALARKNKKMRMTTKTTRDSDSSDSEWDWECLPKNVFDEILDRLVGLSDYVRFGAVCKAWRSIALEDRNYRGNNYKKKRSSAAETFLDRQLPMLMLPQWDEEKRARFYSVTSKKVLDFDLSFLYRRQFIGSSFGWLISVDTELVITLFNPFSGAKIRLPPVVCLTKADITRLTEDGLVYKESLFLKAILSADPSSQPNEFVVMVIFGERKTLAFIRPGADKMQDKRWVRYNRLCGFCDVIYSKSCAAFYALHRDGQVFIIDTYSNAVYRFPPSLMPEPPCQYRYIVETASGDLLQVLRYTQQYSTYDFKAYKVNLSTSPIPYWVELKSLGDDQVLFLGERSSSISVKAADFPGCHPGCIYFSLPYPHHSGLEEPNDMGCFNLQSGLPIERFHISYNFFHSWAATHNPPPIWVVPTFQDAEAAAGDAKKPDWCLRHNRIKFGWIKKNEVRSSPRPRFWDPADWSSVLALSL